MLIHWIWYALLPELHASQKAALLDRFSDPEEIFSAGQEEFAKLEGVSPDIVSILSDRDLTEAEMILESCSEKGIDILTFCDPAYPGRLRNIEDPPMVLYYRGRLPAFESVPAIAVVGTRKATAYGLTTARRMSRQIAACGALVVSGGAYGIDTMAMQGALEAGSPVVGVLGCGLDVVYPKSNQNLFARVVENGCLFSEYPPGTPPYKWNFPRRNRILSGMSNGVLVIEAPEVSGALITARRAFEQGRDVYAVPGNVDVAACAGSNALLQDYAAAACSGWDAVKEYAALYPGKIEKREAYSGLAPEETAQTRVAQIPAVPKKEPAKKEKSDKKGIDNAAVCPYSGIKDTLPVLNQEEKAIVSRLNTVPRPVDEVIAQTGLPAGKVLGMLTMLALKGVVVNHPGRLVSLKMEKQ